MSSVFLNDRKGFVFTLEAVIALLLVAGFIVIASSGSTPIKEMKREAGLQSKELLHSIALEMDINGIVLDMLDKNGVTATEKMNTIKNLIDSQLPASSETRIELKQYDSNAVECKAGLNFDDCFTELGTFPALGDNVPDDKDVWHERFLIVKKQPPAMCEVREETMGLAEEELIEELVPELFFGNKRIERSEGAEELFFAEDDLNISFGVRVTPAGDIECDQTIRVDLNAIVPDFGRMPADIVLVIDKSGSMIDFMNIGVYASGSFNDGTYSSGWLGCSNYGNYQTLGTFEATVENGIAELTPDGTSGYAGIRGQMTNYSYSGSCSRPILRLRFPDNSVENDNSPTVTWQGQVPEGTYTFEGWSDDTISYDVNLFVSKIRLARKSAKTFVDLAEWKDQDNIALVTYNSSAVIEETLTNNRDDVKDEISAIQAGGNTATGEGIYTATDELQEPPTGHGRGSSAMPFQVLLSDGQTNSGRSSALAAADAASKGIKIYTIGFGTDVDEYELQNIANITGGAYYYAEDENVLREVYELIAVQIGADLSQEDPEIAYDSNILVPIPDWAVVTDYGGGTLVEKADGNYVLFDIGLINSANPWADYFEIQFSCNNDNACETSQLVFPSENTLFGYDDESGIPQTPIVFDTNITVNFKYRDLTLKVNKAELISDNLVYLDVNVWNNGWLSSPETDLDFYLHDPITGTFIKQKSVNAFCAGKEPGCLNYIQIFIDETIASEGFIYAIVNRDESIAECSNNNVAEIYCYGGAKIQYYVLDIWMWRK